jgi:hypothetical protein
VLQGYLRIAVNNKAKGKSSAELCALSAVEIKRVAKHENMTVKMNKVSKKKKKR